MFIQCKIGKEMAHWKFNRDKRFLTMSLGNFSTAFLRLHMEKEFSNPVSLGAMIDILDASCFKRSKEMNPAGDMLVSSRWCSDKKHFVHYVMVPPLRKSLSGGFCMSEIFFDTQSKVSMKSEINWNFCLFKVKCLFRLNQEIKIFLYCSIWLKNKKFI